MTNHRHLVLAGLVVLAACSKSDESTEATTTAAGAPVGSLAGLPATPLPELDEVEVSADEIVEVQGSKMVLNPNDAIVSKVIKRDGIWEPLETQLFRARLQPGDVVVDAGANIGYYTLLAARLVGPSGHVYAFEPEPEAFAILARNVELNAYENVTLVAKALGRESGTLKLFLAKKNRGDHRVYDPTGKRESIEVPVVSLDAYLAEQTIAHLDLLKVDTQGAECSILSGARETLTTHRELDVVMEFTPHSLAALGDDAEACLRELAQLGFGFRDIQEWQGTIVETDIDTLLRTYPAADRSKFTNLLLPARTGSP